MATIGAETALHLSWKHALWGGGVAITLVGVALWPTALGLAKTLNGIEAYTHGWLVFPMLVYLLGWHCRADLSSQQPKESLLGFVFAVAAVIGWSAADILGINVGREFALVLVFHAIVLSAVGWQIYKKFFWFLALLFFLVPNGDFVQPILRLLTVKFIDTFANVAGLPHSIDGFFITIGKVRYFVLDACSGLAHFNLMLFLGYCFGLMLFRSIFKVAAVALFAGALGVLSNGIRVNSIVLIDWIQGSQMDLAAHGSLQWIGLGVVFAALLFLLTRLTPEPALRTSYAAEPTVAKAPSKTAVLPISWVPAVAGLTVFFVAILAIHLPNNNARASYAVHIEWLPRNIGDWTLVEPMTKWLLDETANTESLTASYERRGQTLRFVVFEPMYSSGKLSEQVLTPSEVIWRDMPARRVKSCVQIPCQSFLLTTWKRGRAYPPRHTYLAYSVGTFQTESKLALRAVNGLKRLRGGTSHPRLIGLTYEGEEPSIDEVAFVYTALQLALQDLPWENPSTR